MKRLVQIALAAAVIVLTWSIVMKLAEPEYCHNYGGIEIEDFYAMALFCQNIRPGEGYVEKIHADELHLYLSMKKDISETTLHRWENNWKLVTGFPQAQIHFEIDGRWLAK
jgi:hypothetical protein